MNTDILSGNWKSISGEIKKQWGKLTEGDLKKIEENKDKLKFIGILQERYGLSKNKAEEDLKNFLDKQEKNTESFSENFSEGFSENIQKVTDKVKDTAANQLQAYSCQIKQCIQDYPLKSIAAAAGIGLLLGVLIFK